MAQGGSNIPANFASHKARLIELLRDTGNDMHQAYLVWRNSGEEADRLRYHQLSDVYSNHLGAYENIIRQEEAAGVRPASNEQQRNPTPVPAACIQPQQRTASPLPAAKSAPNGGTSACLPPVETDTGLFDHMDDYEMQGVAFEPYGRHVPYPSLAIRQSGKLDWPILDNQELPIQGPLAEMDPAANERLMNAVVPRQPVHQPAQMAGFQPQQAFQGQILNQAQLLQLHAIYQQQVQQQQARPLIPYYQQLFQVHLGVPVIVQPIQILPPPPNHLLPLAPQLINQNPAAAQRTQVPQQQPPVQTNRSAACPGGGATGYGQGNQQGYGGEPTYQAQAQKGAHRLTGRATEQDGVDGYLALYNDAASIPQNGQWQAQGRRNSQEQYNNWLDERQNLNLTPPQSPRSSLHQWLADRRNVRLTPPHTPRSSLHVWLGERRNLQPAEQVERPWNVFRDWLGERQEMVPLPGPPAGFDPWPRRALAPRVCSPRTARRYAALSPEERADLSINMPQIYAPYLGGRSQMSRDLERALYDDWLYENRNLGQPESGRPAIPLTPRQQRYLAEGVNTPRHGEQAQPQQREQQQVQVCQASDTMNFPSMFGDQSERE